MGQLAIKCPETGQLVGTGIGVPNREAAAEMLANPNVTLENNAVGCAACGQTHTWSKSDLEGYLDD
jgi:hypothetical protein